MSVAFSYVANDKLPISMERFKANHFLLLKTIPNDISMLSAIVLQDPGSLGVAIAFKHYSILKNYGSYHRLDAMTNASCAKKQPAKRKINNPLNNRDLNILKIS